MSKIHSRLLAYALVATTLGGYSFVGLANTKNKFLVDANRRYEWGIASSAFSYFQNGSLSTQDKEIGVLPGMKFAVSTIDGGQYFALDIRYLVGRNHFTGHYNLGGVETPYTFYSGRDLLSVKGRIGQPFDFYSQLITPYVQVGFYMWDRKLPAPSTLHGAKASENYNHFDLSLGLKYDLQLAEHWSLDVFGSVGRILGPTLSVGVDGESNIPDFSLGSHTIFEYGMDTYYRLSKDLDLALATSVETFGYGNSSSVVADNSRAYALSGKSSTTFIWKASLGFSWRFSL